MANNDSQMTRFLFAILKQKNLKDIDWNEVAKDPILAQPITNGHAARMRYSRFRSAMLGLEPQKRTKAAGVTKNKSTKKSKEAKTKQEDNIKTEKFSSIIKTQEEPSPPRIKQERHQQHHQHQHQPPTPFHSQFQPMSMPSPMDTPPAFGNRLLTPCSDDLLGGSPGGLMMSPTPEMMGAGAYNLTHCTHSHDGAQGAEAWADPPLFSAFEADFGVDGFGGAMCQHQDMDGHHHTHSGELHHDHEHHDHSHDSLVHAHEHTHEHTLENTQDFTSTQTVSGGTITVKNEWDSQQRF